jgi:hypothetical protein
MGLAVVCFFLFPGFVAAIVGPPLDRIKARRVLSRARSPEELRAAVGSLGAFFPLRDGSWVAVRYTDTHAAPGYSCAVAYDSGGQWLYSNHHFCGRFRLYFQIENQTRRLATALGESEEQILQSMSRTAPEMFALANATNPVAARKQLLTMGFTK